MTTYKQLYALDFNKIDYNMEIRDFYTYEDPNKKRHLVVETNFLRNDYQPDFEKTVVFLHGDNTKHFIRELPFKLVKFDEVVMKPSDQYLAPVTVHFGKEGTIRKKSIIEFPNSRYRGSVYYNKPTKINNDLWFYDLSRNTVNLVISS